MQVKESKRRHLLFKGQFAPPDQNSRASKGNIFLHLLSFEQFPLLARKRVR